MLLTYLRYVIKKDGYTLLFCVYYLYLR